VPVREKTSTRGRYSFGWRVEADQNKKSRRFKNLDEFSRNFKGVERDIKLLEREGF
jgi:hypothetical protein